MTMRRVRMDSLEWLMSRYLEVDSRYDCNATVGDPARHHWIRQRLRLLSRDHVLAQLDGLADTLSYLGKRTAAQAVDDEATNELRARLRGENVDRGAVRDRGFEHVENAAADRRARRPTQGASRAVSGRER